MRFEAFLGAQSDGELDEEEMFNFVKTIALESNKNGLAVGKRSSRSLDGTRQFSEVNK